MCGCHIGLLPSGLSLLGAITPDNDGARSAVMALALGAVRLNAHDAVRLELATFVPSKEVPDLLQELRCDASTVVIGHSAGTASTMLLLQTHRLWGAVLVASCPGSVTDDAWPAIRANLGGNVAVIVDALHHGGVAGVVDGGEGALTTSLAVLVTDVEGAPSSLRRANRLSPKRMRITPAAETPEPLQRLFGAV